MQGVMTDDHVINFVFPRQFCGITHVVKFYDRAELKEFLDHLADGCGATHDHNVAVAFDGNTVYGSELLMECFRKFHYMYIQREL